MPQTQSRADLSLPMQVAALLHHLDRHRRAWEARSQMGTAELRLLWLLTDGEPRSLRQIADALHLEQSTVNRQVNAAVAAGHLRRFRAAGAAAYLFEPTPAGTAQFERDTLAGIGLFTDALDALGPDDGPRLVDLLGRYVDSYGRAVEAGPSSISAGS